LFDAMGFKTRKKKKEERRKEKQKRMNFNIQINNSRTSFVILTKIQQELN